MLKHRLLTSVVGIPIVVAAVWFGAPWFTILIAICGIVGAYEFYRMVMPDARLSFLPTFGIIWSLLFITSPQLKYPHLNEGLLASAVIFPLIGIVLSKKREGAVVAWSWTIVGILYVGWLLSHLVLTRNLPDGRGWIFLALFSTFACDSAAFFAGRSLGKHHLAPAISPRKTWEGASAGFVAAIAVSVFFGWVFNLSASYAELAVAGVLIGFFGQLGDLAESVLKRSTGVKDSSRILPGHGGMLDRLDSVVFVGVVIYYYLVWVVL
jgi:phosphatidate cytidylyltransferase